MLEDQLQNYIIDMRSKFVELKSISDLAVKMTILKRDKLPPPPPAYIRFFHPCRRLLTNQEIWDDLAQKPFRPSLPPGPRGLPLVGYLPFLSPNLHHTFADLAKIYGPIFKLRLGTKLCFVLTSSFSVNEVLRHPETVFDNRDATVSARLYTYGGSDIVFSQNEGDWKKLRKIFTRKMLSKANLDASYPFRSREMRKIIKGMLESAGTPIDIGKLGFFATVKSVMAMTWGGSGGLIGVDGTDLEAKFREVVDELMVLLGTPNLSDLFLVLGCLDLQGIARKMKRVSNHCDKILNSAIEEQKKKGRNGLENQGFLEFLLEVMEGEDNSESITENQIKALQMGGQITLKILFGLAGFEGTELHGNLTQVQLLDALELFKKQQVYFLISTDVAARDLMEKTIVLALATGQKRFSVTLCKFVEKYAEILASQGQLTMALEYVKLLGSEELTHELVILRDRISLSTESEIIFSQIKDFDQLWWLSIVASVMSFTYSTIGLGLGVAQITANGKIGGSLTGIIIGTVTQTQKVWRSFQALGDIAFAYSYSIILIEIQRLRQ
ncbi:flavonoid 3'-monooxygenase-like [Cucumis melo var. makuwa]|uniref:Flavonoid 3'-monooxygenase-like n=2 Tax=Cucumis melo TaxID=3656 RepID=A0A5A7TI81_CUCMM|nr:flavonoid 3'-monooxygenase-like [Cucumis melo var. makuwa]